MEINDAVRADMIYVEKEQETLVQLVAICDSSFLKTCILNEKHARSFLKILDENMRTKAVNRGTDEVNLVFSQEYEPEDRIILEISGEAA